VIENTSKYKPYPKEYKHNIELLFSDVGDYILLQYGYYRELKPKFKSNTYLSI